MRSCDCPSATTRNLLRLALIALALSGCRAPESHTRSAHKDSPMNSRLTYETFISEGVPRARGTLPTGEPLVWSAPIVTPT